MTGAKNVIHEAFVLCWLRRLHILVMPQGVQLLRNGGHYSFAGMVSMLSLLAAHVQARAWAFDVALLRKVHPDSQLSSLTGETIIRKVWGFVQRLRQPRVIFLV